MTQERKPVEVVAALFADSGRFMICQRPAHKARGLLWEFVGGKVEPGESKAEALARECREELDIGIRVDGEAMDTRFDYPDLCVHLTLFYASVTQGEPRLLEHADLRWIGVDEIGEYAFCPADRAILEAMRSGKIVL